eukprot:gene8584-14594_t
MRPGNKPPLEIPLFNFHHYCPLEILLHQKGYSGPTSYHHCIDIQAESTASAGQTDFFARNAPRRGEGSQEETQDNNSRTGIQSDVAASDVLESSPGNAWAVRPAESSTDFQ